MHTEQLNRMGKQLMGNSYLGTFALDQLPAIIFANEPMLHFIINTQTSNLPGQHWIAVTINRNKAYVFDSFGLPPPQLLISQLRQYGVRRILYNSRQIQPINTQMCGQLALQHLFNTHIRYRTRGLPRWKTVVHKRNVYATPNWRRV